MKITINHNVNDNETMAYFTRMNPRHRATADSVTIEYKDIYNIEMCEVLPIFKMRTGYKGFTPYGMARDTGKYIVIARYSHYIKIDKKTGEIISTDAQDDNTDR